MSCSPAWTAPQRSCDNLSCAANLNRTHGILRQQQPLSNHVACRRPHSWYHGVFIPLKAMLPDADVPVVAMSLQAGPDPTRHCNFGEALRPLRDDGVLVVGSGMSFHNLRHFSEGGPASLAFHNWLDGALSGNRAERTRQLGQWSQAPGGRASHPREQHLIPLMVASGAGGDAPARKLWAGMVGPTHLGGGRLIGA